MPTGLLIMKTVFEIMKLRKPAQSIIETLEEGVKYVQS